MPGYITYRTVERAIALVPSLLNVAFQRTRVEGFEKLKATKKFAGDAHDCPPVVEDRKSVV